MHWFTKLYIGLGVGLLGLFGLVRMGGGAYANFGPNASLEPQARQGYWHTYRKPTYTSGPGRSPGGSGGSYGSGGYSGGK